VTRRLRAIQTLLTRTPPAWVPVQLFINSSFLHLSVPRKVSRSTIAAQSRGSVKVRVHSMNGWFVATASDAVAGGQ
jgi:hypothetical protein